MVTTVGSVTPWKMSWSRMCRNVTPWKMPWLQICGRSLEDAMVTNVWDYHISVTLSFPHLVTLLQFALYQREIMQLLLIRFYVISLHG